MLVKVFAKLIAITLGAVLFAAGLELFLVPNQIIDGGVVGISIMISHIFNIQLGILLIVFNIPFLLIGYKQIGKWFSFFTLYAIIIGSLFTHLLHPIHAITSDPMLATVFGGILVGVGVGLVIRNGGSLDGTEITAIMLTKRIPFSVGEVVMFFNIFIMGSAGFVFGWNQAMYSLIAYFIAFKTIDITIEGLDQMRQATIISDFSDEIGDAISKELGRGVTFFSGEGGFSGDHKKIIYCIITRLEESSLTNLVERIDPHAFVSVTHVEEVKGGQFKKKHSHA